MANDALTTPSAATGTEDFHEVPTSRLVVLLILRTVLLLLAALASAGIVAGLHVANPQAVSAFAGNIFVIPVDLLIIWAVVSALRREGRTVASMVGPFEGMDLLRALLVFVVGMVLLYAGTFLGNLAYYHGPPPASALGGVRLPLWFGLLALIVAPATIAIAEEFLYRGYLLPRWRAKIGTWPAVLLVSLFFGLQHIAFFLTSAPAAGVKVFATFLAGVAFAWLALRWKRLWPLLIGHWVLDIIGLGLPTLWVCLATV